MAASTSSVPDVDVDVDANLDPALVGVGVGVDFGTGVDVGVGEPRRSRRKRVSTEPAPAPAGPSMRHEGAAPASTPRRTARKRGGADEAAGEPARGEEDNLNGYEWRNKRRRSGAGPPDDVSTADPALALAGTLASAAAPSAKTRSLPYPFGLTPFVYPCHVPHQPPPPPGDPYATNFRRYIPPSASAASGVNAASYGAGPSTLADLGVGVDLDLSSDPTAFPLGPLPLPVAHHGPNPTHTLTTAELAAMPLLDALYSLGQNTAYPPAPAHAFAGSLAAPAPAAPAPAMPALPVPGDPAYDAAFPPAPHPPAPQPPPPPVPVPVPLLDPASPGEREDGATGPLPPGDRTYAVAAKAECTACREGKEGHGGHWVKYGA
ncbi:hypothetical protein Q5752_005085 [Cryptotrichosporon argae]